MEKRVMDFTPYLRGNEKLLVKQSSDKGSGAIIELCACFTLWLITIALDCFMIGALSQIRTMVKLENNYFIILIPALLIHIVPFGAWMVSIFKRLSPLSNKWYAVTDKRIAVVSGIKPVSVTFLDFSDVTSVLLATNKVIVKFGEEKLVLNGLSDAEELYDVLINAIFPETRSGESAYADRPENNTLPDNGKQNNDEQNIDAIEQNLNDTTNTIDAPSEKAADTTESTDNANEVTDDISEAAESMPTTAAESTAASEKANTNTQKHNLTKKRR